MEVNVATKVVRLTTTWQKMVPTGTSNPHLNLCFLLFYLYYSCTINVLLMNC